MSAYYGCSGAMVAVFVSGSDDDFLTPKVIGLGR